VGRLLPVTRRSAATTMTEGERGARVRLPPPLVFLAGILIGVACARVIARAPVPLDRTLGILAGLVVLAAGVGCILSARIYFVRTGQSPFPWKPTPSLIVTGLYRYTRNPMYVGMTLIELGLGLALDNLWISAFALPALGIVHVTAVRPEEEYLTKKFGESYTRYLTQVRRYF
jgi:protein-S-isoprenylcysteine O-methyltransferase Ste14